MQSNNFMYIVVILLVVLVIQELLDGVRVGEEGLLEHRRTAGPPGRVVPQLEHLVTPAVEKVVGANTPLSGLGAAHSIHNGLTAPEGTHHHWHGEKVAFGAIAMIMQ